MYTIKERVDASYLLYEAALYEAKRQKLVPATMELLTFKSVAVKVLKQLLAIGVEKIRLGDGYVLIRDLD